MKQQTLAGFEKYGKTTRRAQFLAEMDRVVPGAELSAVIEAVLPEGQRRRWPPDLFFAESLLHVQPPSPGVRL
jgi:IS5 family transposase